MLNCIEKCQESIETTTDKSRFVENKAIANNKQKTKHHRLMLIHFDADVRKIFRLPNHMFKAKGD